MIIGKLLDNFLVHPLNHDFQGEAISAFLRDAVERGDSQLSKWSVTLPNTGEGGPVTPALRSGLQVEAKKRRVLARQMQSLLVSGKKARVGSRADVRHGLSTEQVAMVTQAEREQKPDLKDVPEDAYRAALSSPLLVVYLLRGVERENQESPEMAYKNGLVLPALGIHFPGIKDLDAPKRFISYRLNRVAQAELELDGDDFIDEADED